MITRSSNNNPSGGEAGQQAAWRKFGWLVAIAAGLVGLNIYLWGFFSDPRPLPAPPVTEAPAEMSFDGNSKTLAKSILVPTLQRPIPEGKSAIWCATMPMAWKEGEGAFKEP